MLGVVCAIGALAGDAAAYHSSDAWITTKTKIALVTAGGAGGANVHVDTLEGTVFLHGRVDAVAVKDKAAAIAAQTKGVRAVRNLIRVVPTASEKAVESKIEVKEISRGAVLLSGTAVSLSDLLRGLESAWTVGGVRSVAGLVTSPERIAELDLPFDTSVTAARSGARDAWITAATKMNLLADGDVPALDIDVDTTRRVVTLFGIVPTVAAMAAAEADARRIPAVLAVDNDLQVVAAANRERIKASDDDVARSVTAALKTRPELANVNVVVQNGVARLTGTVPSGWYRLYGAVVVRAVKGVRSVRDDIHIAARAKS
jgi:osmotically-inducible protein OsmY